MVRVIPEDAICLLGRTTSQPSELLQGVPQGSVLGAVLFILYTGPIGQIIIHHQLNFHTFADDSQLYVSFKINDPTDEKAALTRIQACVREIKAWLNHNRLHLNDNKTELLQLYHPTRTLRSSSDYLLTEHSARLRNYGDRAFCVAAPKLWNNLPLNMRECGSVNSFKRLLKTHLFKRAFNI